MTTAIPSAKTQFWLSKASAVQFTLVPTAITKAKPAMVTVADTGGLVAGQVVHVKGTGFTELDDKWFMVGTIDGTAKTFTLVGSDTTASTGTLATGGGAAPTVIALVEGGDLLKFCVSSFSREAGTADTVAVGTFCDPSATIAGTSSAGTASFAGYMDPTEAGYLELLKAADDQIARYLIIRLPDNKGVVVLQGQINSFSEDYALGNAISWSSGMALSTKPTYIWP